MAQPQTQTQDLTLVEGFIMACVEAPNKSSDVTRYNIIVKTTRDAVLLLNGFHFIKVNYLFIVLSKLIYYIDIYALTFI